MYHYITVQFVMRDCESKTDAKRKCVKLLPCDPDSNTTYMESWTINNVREVKSDNENLDL